MIEKDWKKNITGFIWRLGKIQKHLTNYNFIEGWGSMEILSLAMSNSIIINYPPRISREN